MIKQGFLISASLFAFGFVANVASASAEQLYFYVQNNHNSTITKLFVGEPNKTWGIADVGTGIASGESAKLIWHSSTDNELCKQWLKAQFADGSESQPALIDFCEKLDVPIVFQ